MRFSSKIYFLLSLPRSRRLSCCSVIVISLTTCCYLCVGTYQVYLKQINAYLKYVKIRDSRLLFAFLLLIIYRGLYLCYPKNIFPPWNIISSLLWSIQKTKETFVKSLMEFFLFFLSFFDISLGNCILAFIELIYP